MIIGIIIIINQVPFNLRSHIRKFEVRLGPPGGDKGYKVTLIMMRMIIMVILMMMTRRLSRHTICWVATSLLFPLCDPSSPFLRKPSQSVFLFYQTAFPFIRFPFFALTIINCTPTKCDQNHYYMEQDYQQEYHPYQ